MGEQVDYQQALGHFATGVTVVTANHGGEHFAMTASALTSVSLDPILLLVCFSHDSDTRLAVRETGRFGLSVLGEGSAALAKRLASNRRATPDQLDLVNLREGRHGVPLLADAVAHCVCSVERVLRAADHDVVVGAVEWIDRGTDHGPPLVYYQSQFWQLARLDEQSAPTDV